MKYTKRKGKKLKERDFEPFVNTLINTGLLFSDDGSINLAWLVERQDEFKFLKKYFSYSDYDTKYLHDMETAKALIQSIGDADGNPAFVWDTEGKNYKPLKNIYEDINQYFDKWLLRNLQFAKGWTKNRPAFREAIEQLITELKDGTKQ